MRGASAFTLALLSLSTPAAALIATPRINTAPRYNAVNVKMQFDMATRRKVLPVALFGLLGTRIAVLVNTKETFVPTGDPTFDPTVAIEASRAAGQCPVQSCNTARLTEMQFSLDTSKVGKNSKGSAASHKPIVWVEPDDGKKTYSARIVMVAPAASGDAVRLMWITNKATGQIIGSKVVEEEGTRAGTVSGAAAQGVGDGPATLVATARKGYAGVERNSIVVPHILYANDGLWIGEEFALCGEGSECKGAYGPADFMLDTRGRRPRGDIGLDVLKKVTAAR